MIRAPVGGQAGGGKSANGTPEGWVGPEKGQPDEIEADDPITLDYRAGDLNTTYSL